MTRVNESDIVDLRVGSRLVSALMAGQEPVWVRYQSTFYQQPGTFRHELPDWVTGFATVIFSGGGGGREGDGGNNTPGKGGSSGKGEFGAYTLGTGSARTSRIDITVGAGGSGGPNAQNGGQSSLYFSTFSLRPGVGVFGAAPGQNGGTYGWTSLSEQMAKRVNRAPGSSFISGPAGGGNGGNGLFGGGGAGGNGGLFGSYSNGGRGGNGFCDIYMWGKLP